MELLAFMKIAASRKTRVFQLKFPTPNVWAKSLCLSINIKFGESFMYGSEEREGRFVDMTTTMDVAGVGVSFNEPALTKSSHLSSLRKHRSMVRIQLEKIV